MIEIADERERFEAIAQDYAKNPTRHVSHFTSQSRTRRTQFRLSIDNYSAREMSAVTISKRRSMSARPDMTGAERTFANSYRPDEDIIRYNRNSKVYKGKAGEYARVIDTNHEKNEITVRFDNGRKLTTTRTAFRCERLLRSRACLRRRRSRSVSRSL